MVEGDDEVGLEMLLRVVGVGVGVENIDEILSEFFGVGVFEGNSDGLGEGDDVDGGLFGRFLEKFVDFVIM